jgi:hypothetical protein
MGLVVALGQRYWCCGLNKGMLRRRVQVDKIVDLRKRIEKLMA